MTKRKRKSTSRRTHVERRAQSERSLVDAAIAIVGKRGVSAMTFETIGEESGYSRSLVTQHFGSKRGLVEAVISDLHARATPLVAAGELGMPTKLESLLASIELYLRELNASDELKSYFKLLSFAVADNDELRGAFADEHERVRQALANHVRQGQREGSIRKELDADAVATMIGSFQLGIAMQLLVDPATKLGPVLAAGLAALRNGLKAGPTKFVEHAKPAPKKKMRRAPGA